MWALALACGCASSQDTPGRARTFRVLTYNIHHGEGLDKKVDVRRIAELIKGEKADIVALQEVDRGVQRTARRDLGAELAELTGLTCVFSNNFHFQGGEYGNAVLTGFSVKSGTNMHYRMLRPGEQRGLLQLELEVYGRKLLFMNTHIDYRPDDSERLQNVAEIEALTRRHRVPILLCGDFNDTPGSRTHQRLAKIFVDSWSLAGEGEGFTFSAGKPVRRIDYIWVSRDKSLAPVKMWVPRSDASDHLPVAGEFRFRD